jgi:precorrin-6Y C5,15-methyltransferase (decarboxylating)
MDPDDYALIIANAERFGVRNLVPVLGRAPDAWAELPDADAIFVGGSGHEIGGVVELAFERLRRGGRIVVSAGSIDTLTGVRDVLGRLAETKVWMVNIARSTYQLERMRFEALNPSFLIAAVKQTVK